MSFPNAARKLHMPGTSFKWSIEGALGAVFIDQDGGRARKIYFNRGDSKLPYCMNVFQSEVSAYEKAQAAGFSGDLTANFYGVVKIDKVFDKDLCDVTNEFIVEAALEVDYLPGYFEKINCAPEEEYQRVAKLFISAGINYIGDASVIIDSSKITKIVDFAVEYIEAVHFD